MKRALEMERSSFSESSQETGPGSPTSSIFNDMKLISSPSPKRRRSVQKRLVTVPIKDVEGSRMKGETAPPSDSWAWRKYGQKPIKGSPYPRGYYRCSSSKGCPARKQVERNRDDPTMILVTYTCEHNHPWPASKTGPIKHRPKPEPEPEPEIVPELELEPEQSKFMDLGEIGTTPSCVDEFAWFGEMETTSSTILESPIFSSDKKTVPPPENADVAMFFPMREEDESLFADLGELPECSAVFRRPLEIY
ncbi:PREDICTED: probable WRKY transcription factor 65 isoform X2 [Tarenaya hassleriana]|uniref:probable WRKY transcription factor 65 isoform X2 n=1 Tax=Tarenaya hassleriana TaxID=28532 RepID=UPI00053C5FAA|nr:PREDICTED: probable WRKY transcription factor 65 isoform X2 [Tarenaya hassleriana]